MKRFMMFCSGLLLTLSMMGCCCSRQPACGPCGGYGASYGGGGCPGGACGASAPGYPQAFNGGSAYPQAAFAPGVQAAYVEPMPTF